MLILSQDKTQTTECLSLRVENLSYLDKKLRWQVKGWAIRELDYYRIIGKYETEERANQILKELFETYSNNPTSIYEMPKK